MPAMSSGDDEFVSVFGAPSIPVGEVAKTKLESEGIQVLVKGGTPYAYPTGTIELWVRRDQLARAKRILSDVDLAADSDQGTPDADPGDAGAGTPGG
jgi:Putative prokaryotic signal transducing protein